MKAVIVVLMFGLMAIMAEAEVLCWISASTSAICR